MAMLMWWVSEVNLSSFLCPARALLARIPLGPRPLLHRLRSGWRRLVRQLPSSYYGVRLPAPVHHRLQLLAFPMRTRAIPCQWSDVGSPSFRRSPFARDVFFDPGRATVPRITAPLILRSAMYHGLRPCTSSISWLVRHPMQLLCTLRGRRYRRLTQHSLPSDPLRPYSDRSCTGWTAPAILAPSAPRTRSELNLLARE